MAETFFFLRFCQTLQQSGKSGGLLGELGHAVHHLLRGGDRRVVLGGALGGHHNRLQGLTESPPRGCDLRRKRKNIQSQILFFHSPPHPCCTHLGPQVGRGQEAGQRVPDEDQLVRRHDEALPSGHEDAGRLVALHAAVQHVDGVCQAGQVSQALGRVEGQQLRVLQGQGRQLLGEG